MRHFLDNCSVNLVAQLHDVRKVRARGLRTASLHAFRHELLSMGAGPVRRGLRRPSWRGNHGGNQPAMDSSAVALDELHDKLGDAWQAAGRQSRMARRNGTAHTAPAAVPWRQHCSVPDRALCGRRPHKAERRRRMLGKSLRLDGLPQAPHVVRVRMHAP